MKLFIALVIALLTLPLVNKTRERVRVRIPIRSKHPWEK